MYIVALEYQEYSEELYYKYITLSENYRDVANEYSNLLYSYNQANESYIKHVDQLNKSLQNKQEKFNLENTKKKRWRKLAIGEGVLIAGAAGAIITGLWVPIIIGVVVVEGIIIFVGK